MNTPNKEHSSKNDAVRIPLNKESSYEWWYFDGQSDDGTAFQLHFQCPAKSYINSKACVQIRIRKPNGMIISEELFVDDGDFYADENSCNVKIGKSTLHGGPSTYEIYITTGSLSAKLTYENHCQSLSGPDSSDSPPYLSWFVEIPYGKVTGSLIYDNKEHNFKGNGYHDHNWGEGDLGQVMEEWYWGRVSINDYTIVFANLRPKNTNFPVFLFLLKNGKLIEEHLSFSKDATVSVTPSELYKNSAGKYQPGVLQVSWEKGDNKFSLKFENPKRIQETYEYSRLSGRDRDNVQSDQKTPSYMSFLSDVSLDITYNDNSEHLNGVGLYEHRKFS
ncbi:hypothetical protein FR992_27355 [Serratia marcescens]|uniref:hypothetical protein n=2 Tax=Serratia marcescens TaxID=615 RepID=UPI0011BA112D|nr:hypothetical protein [Serratia marcescens]TWY26582.1 hypothetical protein FR992_27355 [Serratia marcescens]